MGLWDNIEVKKEKAKDEFNFHSESNRYNAIENIADLIKNNDEEKEKLHNLLLEKALIKRKKDSKSWFAKFFSIFDKTDNKKDSFKKSENPYLIDPKKSLELISNLLDTKLSNSKIDLLFSKFCEIIEKDYMEFADQDDLPNEAEMYDKLIKVKEKIDNAIKFPEMLNITIIGIGGGFSAGKSSFVNAILNSEKDILPTDTRPTTSIPTYVLKGEKDLSIYSYNIFGEKLLIDNDALLAISHEFHRLFNLSLTSVIKKITVDTPEMKYKEIAFLDTPGYTKSESKTKNDNTDEEIAKKHLSIADYLIWVIDIEQGTIPKNDINFLASMEFENPILIIFNKADKKPEKEIIKIIEKTRTLLSSKNLNIENVVAYSSVDKLEYGSEFDINTFLESKDKVLKTKIFSEEISEIMGVYEKHHSSGIEKGKKLLNVLNKIDTLAYKQLNDLPEFSETLDDTRQLIREKKRVQSLLFELKNKLMKTTMEIDKYFDKRR
jgi:GTP-binding protein EngB required for normal cell division